MSIVMLVYKGYEWRCPSCFNYTPEAHKKYGAVNCSTCGAEHTVNGIVSSDEVATANKREEKKPC